MNLIDIKKKIEETNQDVIKSLESKNYEEVKSLLDKLKELESEKEVLVRLSKIRQIEPLFTNRFEVEFDNEELNYFNFCVQGFQDLYDMNFSNRLIVITFLGTLSTIPINIIKSLDKTRKVTLKLLDPTLRSIHETVYNVNSIKHIELPMLTYEKNELYRFKVTLSYH